jgi:hypothetical protein
MRHRCTVIRLQYRARVPAPPLLFDRLLDDAAMFPPGNADAATAVAEHLGYRAGELDAYVGPLLVHADRWLELAAAHAAAGSPALDAVVLGTAERPRTVPGVRVVGFELPVGDLPLPAAQPGLPIACEIRADESGHRVLEAIASAAGDYIGKFRTGGTTADVFPDEATVASVVVDAVRVGAPMKFTAGLHHAVRFRDAQTGFEHHGFVNLMVAAHAALGGAGEHDVASILHQRSGDDLAAEIASWSPEDAKAVRRVFVSFGCCGVTDPVRDLISLGLLPAADLGEGAR